MLNLFPLALIFGSLVVSCRTAIGSETPHTRWTFSFHCGDIIKPFPWCLLVDLKVMSLLLRTLHFYFILLSLFYWMAFKRSHFQCTQMNNKKNGRCGNWSKISRSSTRILDSLNSKIPWLFNKTLYLSIYISILKQKYQVHWKWVF